jgi:UDP-N-acetylglucosamine 2-epimerase
MSSQIDDFEKNEYVDIVAAAGDMSYEKVLTESSLMITDYSGVQFDFAYMRKPVLYYHPATLPPHYTESTAFSHEKDGFGPIITDHEELVDRICRYMEQECRMEPFYRERADRFFAYDDTDNCRRIAEVLLQMSEQLEREHTAQLPVSCKFDFIPISDPDMLGRLFRKKPEENRGIKFNLKKAIKRWIRRKN